MPAAEDALIRLDPGFSRPLKICRLDAFLQGYDVKFLEFNADSPAGIGYTDVLYEGLRRSIDLPRVDAEFETVLHADAAGADRDAARRVPGAARRALRPSRDAAARAGGRGGQPVGAGVPNHLRGGEARRRRGGPRHPRRGGLRRLAAARAGRTGASGLPQGAARGPARGRPDRRRARPPSRRGEPVPRPRGEQQEALRPACRPALRPPRGGRGAACDRRDDPVDARASRRPRRVR